MVIASLFGLALGAWMLVPVVAVLSVPMTVVLEVDVVSVTVRLVTARLFNVDVAVVVVATAVARLHADHLLAQLPASDMSHRRLPVAVCAGGQRGHRRAEHSPDSGAGESIGAFYGAASRRCFSISHQANRRHPAPAVT